MKKHQVPISLVAAAAIVCPALETLANTEAFTANFGSSSAPLAIGGPAFPLTLGLPLFDTSLGSLTGVEVTVNTTDNLTARVANLRGATTFTDAAATGTITLTGLAGAQSSATLATTPVSDSIAPGSFASPTYYLGPTASSSGTGSAAVALSDFGAYEANGGGNLDFSVDASFDGDFSGSAHPGVSFGGVATLFGNITVDYTYTDPPNPAPDGGSPLLLALLSLGGMAGFSRLSRVLPVNCG